MPTALTTQRANATGLNPAYTAADADGHTVALDGAALHVKNGGGSPVSVTMRATRPYFDGVTRDIVVVVPAGGERLIKPADPLFFGDSSGRVLFDFSAVTSVTVAALAI